MGNVFAIGIPDNVGRAERDNYGSIKNFTRSTKHEKKKRDYRTKVIEFDLPKEYSAEDAFLTAMWWTDNMWWIDNATIHDYDNFLWWSDIARHFDVYFLIPMSKFDRANFFLLLAAANGHKLE